MRCARIEMVMLIPLIQTKLYVPGRDLVWCSDRD